jgi:predicted KAP-like P-loop ATPase
MAKKISKALKKCIQNVKSGEGASSSSAQQEKRDASPRMSSV